MDPTLPDADQRFWRTEIVPASRQTLMNARKITIGIASVDIVRTLIGVLSGPPPLFSTDRAEGLEQPFDRPPDGSNWSVQHIPRSLPRRFSCLAPTGSLPSEPCQRCVPAGRTWAAAVPGVPCPRDRCRRPGTGPCSRARLRAVGRRNTPGTAGLAKVSPLGGGRPMAAAAAGQFPNPAQADTFLQDRRKLRAADLAARG